LSFVYSVDIANCIIDLIHSYETVKALTGPYNIGFNQHPTLQEFVDLIQAALDPSEKANCNDGDTPGFPSVDCGHLDLSKATEKFGWKPTELSVAVKEIVAWYENAWDKRLFKEEFRDASRYLGRFDGFKDFIRDQFRSAPAN